ncbi:MAG: type II secretion system GspH family protein [Holosporales bacterium]|jgi:prepilin-type N-terminal cleavage/methylation domain-containing protein|nr:type II secretion system GspH family protein [Holosporales bacterium]
MRQRRGHKNAGFSLLEVAIALMVLGILSNIILQSTLTMQKRLQVRTTQEHMEMIFASLAAHALRHSCLPPPDKNIIQAGSSYIGTVPYEKLGMSAFMVQDGWKRPILYIVEEELTKTKALTKEGLGITLDTEQSFCDVTKMTLRFNTTSFDQNNTDPSAVIAVVLYSAAETAVSLSRPLNEGSVFDMNKAQMGIVRWVSRDVLMAVYGRYPCHQTGNDTSSSDNPTHLTNTMNFF